MGEEQWTKYSQEINAKSFEHKKKAYVLFVDFKQTYNNVKKEQLLEALRKFTIRTVLRQGNPLSPILYNVAVKKILRQVNVNRGGIIHHKKVSAQRRCGICCKNVGRNCGRYLEFTTEEGQQYKFEVDNIKYLGTIVKKESGVSKKKHG